MIYQPTPVSRDFYDIILKTFPEALAQSRYARFLDHLFFGSFCDRVTGYRIFPEELLADMEDMAHKLQNNSRNYNRARIFPEEFEEATGLHLHKGDYRFIERKASSYEFKSLPQEVEKAWKAELLNPVFPSQEGVYLDTGKPPTKKRLDRQKEKFIALKEAYMRGGTLRTDVQFLNKTSRFSTFLDRQVAQRKERAIAAANKIPNLEKRAFAIRTLSKLPTFEPLYVATHHSQRIYTAGTSLQNFASSVRAAILEPSRNYDLTAAQLAIMGTHWEVPVIQDLVQAGKVWEKFCRSLCIPAGLIDRGVDLRRSVVEADQGTEGAAMR